MIRTLSSQLLYILFLIFIVGCSDATNDSTRSHLAESEVGSSVSSAKNILYIMTDDHAAHAVGAYKGRFAELNPTPNIDALANEGVLFANVFVTNSICTPSRASILTGQYSQTNGVLTLEGSIDSVHQYLPRLMTGAGYDTAVIGKWHLKEEPAAFQYYEVLDSQGDYFDPTFRTRGKQPWPLNETTYKGHSSDVITNLSTAWLKNRRSTKPFFLMHQFKAPHDMFEYAPRYAEYLAADFVPEPTDLYGVKATFGSVATRGINNSLIHKIGTSVSKRHARRSMGIDLGVDPNLPDDEFTREAYQRYVKAFLRCVKGVDDNIARIVQTLKDIGEYDNTIIIYTSDQGMMLGEHDYQDKRWMYDESIRMPFIVKHPDIKKTGIVNDLLINNTDFAPFILDLANIATPSYMQGKSFTSSLFGVQPENWRTATYYRYWTHREYHDVPAHFGLRTKEFKLIFFYAEHFMTSPVPYYDEEWVAKTGESSNAVSTPVAWELYHLSVDPEEQHNVYNDPQYADIVITLKAELLRQREVYNETDIRYPHLQRLIDQHWND